MKVDTLGGVYATYKSMKGEEIFVVMVGGDFGCNQKILQLSVHQF